MKCTFEKWGANKYSGPSYCLKADRGVEHGYFCKYCSSGNYDKCSIYQENQQEDCFFRAILEKIGKLDDNNIILESLKKFRREILENNNSCRYVNKILEYRKLLVMHDRISPVIANAIRNTSINTIDEFLNIIHNTYIIPINNFIIENQTEKAIDYYKKMLELLIVNFSLNQEYASMKYRYAHPELYEMKKGKKIKERRMRY